MERVAVDERSVPQREHLHRRPRAFDCEADHVERTGSAGPRRLALGEVIDREQPIPISRSVFEALLDSGSLISSVSTERIVSVSPSR